ncbi:response regulator [Candidatus Nomurabacteria bacterium]|nr:response regulator [Candidatus Nomurabacteria bacterium]
MSTQIEESRRFLVLDDDPTILGLYAEVIQSVYHCDQVLVRGQHDIEDVIKLILVKRINAVLTDNNMSGFLGIDLLHKLVKLERDFDYHFQVLILNTGMPSLELQTTCAALGVQFLSKPLSLPMLSQSVKAPSRLMRAC